MTPDEVIEVVGFRTERTIQAMVPPRPYMALTAGRDTRSLLACSRAVAEQVEFFTIAIPDRQAALDVDLARRLARRIGLNHRVIEPLPASEAELDEWQRRVDRTIAGRT